MYLLRIAWSFIVLNVYITVHTGQIHPMLYYVTALVVTGGQDKSILIHSVEDGALGKVCCQSYIALGDKTSSVPCLCVHRGGRGSHLVCSP